MSGPGTFFLDEMELDALTELVNIGVGRAAASLGTMVGEQVLLSVPSVMVVSRSRAAELISQSKNELAGRGAPGVQRRRLRLRAADRFPRRTAWSWSARRAGKELSLEDILELEHEALAEIGNIILNACMATVANLLHRSSTMSLPEIIRGTGVGLFDLAVSMSDDVVLFVHINFCLKGHQLATSRW